jgi:ribosome-binding factor A
MAKRFDNSSGPTQRQLRAGENIRHVLVAILRKGEIRDPALVDKSITVGEVRMSPDLKHANIFVAALGLHDGEEIAAALNRASKYLRGECGRALASKFTPDLRFLADTSYDAALKMNDLFNDPKVRADLDRVEDDALLPRPAGELAAKQTEGVFAPDNALVEANTPSAPPKKEGEGHLPRGTGEDN